MNYRQILEGSGFSLDGPCSKAAEIRRFESAAMVKLPEQYKEFLKTVGAASIWNAEAPVRELSPRGRLHSVSRLLSAKEVYERLSSFSAPRNTIVIAEGHLHEFTVLSVAGIDYGSVYAVDGEGRCFWPDELFEKRFKAMASEIREYLSERAAGLLSQKPAGYECLYQVASSFDEFISNISPTEDGDGDDA